MTNELVPSGQSLPAVADDAALDKLAGSGFLPYIQLVGSSSKLGKSGDFPIGNFALIDNKEKRHNLTKSFECLVLARRACAKNKTLKGVFAFYDQNSAEYKKVEAIASGGGLTNAWHGTEYLTWIPGHGFAAYHASNPTARSACKELNTILKTWREQLAAADAATGAKPKVDNPQAKFVVVMVDYSNGNSQHGPSFTRATTPFAVLPDSKDVYEQVTKFVNPPKSKIEAVASTGDMG